VSFRWFRGLDTVFCELDGQGRLSSSIRSLSGQFPLEDSALVWLSRCKREPSYRNCDFAGLPGEPIYSGEWISRAVGESMALTPN